MKAAIYLYLLILAVFLFLSMIFVSILIILGQLGGMKDDILAIHNILTEAEICGN